jgi:hypothetical protein
VDKSAAPIAATIHLRFMISLLQGNATIIASWRARALTRGKGGPVAPRHVVTADVGQRFGSGAFVPDQPGTPPAGDDSCGSPGARNSGISTARSR